MPTTLTNGLIGRRGLLKKGTVTIAGLITKNITVNSEPVDMTSMDDVGYRKLIDDDIGQKTVEITADGIFKSNVLIDEILASDASAIYNFEFGTEDNKVSGTFIITSLEVGAQMREAITVSLTLQSTNFVVNSVAPVPSLLLDFAGTRELNHGITFTRASGASYYDSAGVLRFASSNQARFDHDPVTGESLGLLIEEQRTNLLTRSEEFDDASWIKDNATVTANTVVAPDGTLMGDKLVENTATSAHTVRKDGISVTSGTTYTFSFFAKAAERTSVLVNFSTGFFGTDSAAFDLSSGTSSVVVGSPTHSIQSVGNGWFRCVFALAAISTGSANFTPNISLRSGTSSNYTGDGSSGVFIWGAQLEAGPFPTSYIPTTSATVTRSADSASMTGANFTQFYNASEGTLFADIKPAALAATSGVVINDNTVDNRIRLATTSATDQGTVTVAGTGQAELDGGTPVANTSMKLALGYKVDDFALSLDGGSVATDTSGTVPVVTQLQLGAETTSIGTLTIKKFAYYPRRLADAILESITS
jgi:predicted secreted protein